MAETEYNLLDEKWILAIDGTDRIDGYSLKTIFADAHRLTGLAGEIPTQDLAIMRLLIAVLYAVYQDHDETGNEAGIEDRQEALRRWKALWKEGRFDSDTIDGYLESYRDRFYLFHPTRPFYQAPISKGTEYDASKLNGELSESNNKPRLFVPLSGRRRERLGYAEAARWLLNLNGYDDTSSKPTVRGAGMPSTGAGWIGKLGPVYIRGNTLFETLMLNLVLLSDEGEPFPRGEPTWEPDEARVQERVEIPLPESPVELLTLQSRRLLLEREGEEVTGYLLMGGDIVPKENAFTEQMTLWRQSDEGVFVPRRLDPARSMWRDYQSILLRASDDGKIKRPGVVRWLELLEDSDIIRPGSVTVAAVGVKYADKDFFIENFVSDSITVNGGLLSALNEGWNVRIADAIAVTDACVGILGRYVWDISDILDDDSGKAKASEERAQAYYELDRPFRDWLRGLDPSKDDIERRMGEWIETESRIVRRRAKRILEESGEMAMKGKDGDSVFTAYKNFSGRLYKETHKGVTE